MHAAWQHMLPYNGNCHMRHCKQHQATHVCNCACVSTHHITICMWRILNSGLKHYVAPQQEPAMLKTQREHATSAATVHPLQLHIASGCNATTAYTWPAVDLQMLVYAHVCRHAKHHARQRYLQIACLTNWCQSTGTPTKGTSAARGFTRHHKKSTLPLPQRASVHLKHFLGPVAGRTGTRAVEAPAAFQACM